MIEVLKENWLQFLIPTFSPLVIISGILLLLANKHERILFTPRRALYRQLIKVIILSIIVTIIGYFLINMTALVLNKEDIIASYFDLFLLFIVYLILMPINIRLAEKNDITYHWIYLEKYQYVPLLIHKITFNNKLLLKSLTFSHNKFDQGFIIIEETTILNNEKIYFIGPKKKNPFYVNRPKKEDFVAAIEQNKPSFGDEVH
ncbi:hypothetical protein [Paenibacillus sp. MER 99-2]|uniref:hypothetical protein n=1 Tax=Paenibacillus sp. MER 99-2 TaxID=2939572 RepID=UPI00203FCD3D|nr:hypothetical protein [Paenibacillus sp. MER 99-2]MCM3173250.1 hypothetical protein [Paenibacillus sp. MER 99-2]